MASGEASTSCIAAATSPRRPPIWNSLSHDALLKLITDQIPRFQQRPYLENHAVLRTALADGPASALLNFEGDFCWSLCFTAAFLRALIFEGFLPIAAELGGGTGLFVLLPKLHTQRCILSFPDLHVPKKVRKRACRKRYSLTVDDAFEDIMAGCLEQHGASWLHPPLRDVFAELAPPSSQSPELRPLLDVSDAAKPPDEVGERATASPSSSSSPTSSPRADDDDDDWTAAGSAAAIVGLAVAASSSAAETSSTAAGASTAADGAPATTAGVTATTLTAAGDDADSSGFAAGGSSTSGSSARLCSFALWLDGELVAGEFGAVCGCSYTSYSGFYRRDGAGGIQMALTAKVLQAAGFAFWDMGQEHAYKLGHGARLLPRQAFLERFREERCRPNTLAQLIVRSHGGRFGAADLLRPPPPPGLTHADAMSANENE